MISAGLMIEKPVNKTSKMKIIFDFRHHFTCSDFFSLFSLSQNSLFLPKIIVC